MLSVFIIGLFVGIFSILCLEVIGVLFVLNRLNRKIRKKMQQETDATSTTTTTFQDSQHSLDFICNIQGVVWVLESEKIAAKEQKRKRDMILEVSPVRKLGKIHDKCLSLTHSDSSYTTTIPLRGCLIQAVSATNLPSRKWAKRYPIKVENKSSLIYNGSKIIYLFLETAWEKESWCKGLRLASCEDIEKLNWFTKLNMDFQAYIALLNAGYSSFMKPSVCFSIDPTDKGSSKSDGSVSKVKSFWRKLSRKPVKHGSSSNNHSPREERSSSHKQHQHQDSVSSKASNGSADENMTFPLPSGFPRSASQGCASFASDADSEQDRLCYDDGILCWNLLISRVFFDIKGNAQLKSSFKARIQRTLSNMRIPSYMGEVICTNIDIGTLPPYIHAMRLLGPDMDEVSAFEVDAEYSGGVLLDVETRIQVRDRDFQKGLMDTNSESSENVSSELLEGFEHFEKRMNLPEDDGIKGSKASSGSRWKSVLNSVAKQVSQVPLTLSVRVASLRGTLRLYIKPPPSDQLWFGFTTMPDIEFVVESSVGDCKITNTHFAVFLINRFKAAIRETMVLPNCESACIPWMLAEKEDWVPRNAAPFIWLRQEATSDNKYTREAMAHQVTESKANEHIARALSCDPECKGFFRASAMDSAATTPTISSPMLSPCVSYRSLQDLRCPFIPINELNEVAIRNREGTSTCPSLHSRSAKEYVRQSEGIDDNGLAAKAGKKRVKLRDFKKKIGEKFEEKKRNMVEKMKSK